MLYAIVGQMQFAQVEANLVRFWRFIARRKALIDGRLEVSGELLVVRVELVVGEATLAGWNLDLLVADQQQTVWSRLEVEVVVADLSDLICIQVQILQLSIDGKRIRQLRHWQLVESQASEQRIECHWHNIDTVHLGAVCAQLLVVAVTLGGTKGSSLMEACEEEQQASAN